MTDPILIIGAGQAGAAMAAKLRHLGYDGPLVMIGEEPQPPYQRPPLSKKYMSGELELSRLLVRPESWYREQGIELRLDTAAVALSPRDRRVTLADGSELSYAKLALTTGARPRRLPSAMGGELAGVLAIRTVADVDSLAPHLSAGKKLLVVGGGYIGLEAAAVAAAKGLNVTVVEVAPRILQRVACPHTSDFFRDLHRRHGVDVRESAVLEALLGKQGHLTGAQMQDGSLIEADIAIVGIGIAPNDDLARGAGLAVENGIRVDGSCRSSAADIFAAGDCANFDWRGLPTRLESVQNAVDQAEHAAAAMLGATGTYHPVPWFWSDQYDIKLQIAGLCRGYDDAVVRPGKRAGSQSVWYFAGERLLAVDAMNDALAYALGKKILEAGGPIPKTVAADPAGDLKSWTVSASPATS
jgi:3-phenylpropionate/trans-cinnamate dioxygenase ferredoxin reductase subunit